MSHHASNMNRVVQITALKNLDVYSAPSVVIPIFGYAQIGVRSRQDGARLVSSIKFYFLLIIRRKNKFYFICYESNYDTLDIL